MNLLKMKVLLDTNIIIHREASKVYNEDIGLLFKWLDKLHYTKNIHPLSMKEIGNYKDEEVVRIMAIKASNYFELQTESPESDQILEIRKNDRTENDYIDTSLLKELLNKRVDFLITEDRGIHKKAKLLGISEKTYTIESFIEKCTSEYPDLKEYKVLSVKKDYFGNLDLDDEFFNSFIEDYNEFKDWFNRKSENISYVTKTDDKIKAFLYIKVEDPNSESYKEIQPAFEPKKRLKIGTFKVQSTGYKLGERFLKIIFDNALANSVEEIYVTIFDKRDEQQRLITVLEDWGFTYWGTKTTQNGVEKVYVRNFLPHLEANPRFSYPYIDRNSRVYLCPIWQNYHTDLFPDSILNNESPLDYIENEPHRNALKKVYICRSVFKNLRRGDIILFYRTGGRYESVISTIGVVESTILNIPNEDEFIKLCRKRSVFKDDELKEWWNYKPHNRPFIVNFLYIDSFPKPKVNLDQLIQLGIIRSIDNAPRGFEQISNEKFEIFLKAARANESYFIN
jgi:hypothetical protein